METIEANGTWQALTTTGLNSVLIQNQGIYTVLVRKGETGEVGWELGGIKDQYRTQNITITDLDESIYVKIDGDETKKVNATSTIVYG
jgi:hypothetical protein